LTRRRELKKKKGPKKGPPSEKGSSLSHATVKKGRTRPRKKMRYVVSQGGATKGVQRTEKASNREELVGRGGGHHTRTRRWVPKGSSSGP